MIEFQLGYSKDGIRLDGTDKDVDKIANASADLWLKERHGNTIKAANRNVQVKIVELVYKAFIELDGKDKVDGLILPNESQAKTYLGNGLEFRIGAPFVFLMKLAPNGHFIHNYDYPDLWKSVNPDYDLFLKLRNAYLQGLGTKYRPMYNTKQLPEDYILFAHQGLDDVHYYTKKSGLELMADVADWANQNKKTTIIRWHPTAYDDVARADHLRSKYVIFDTDSYIVDLIKGCSRLWTASSSCGMEALVMGKPVTTFGSADYSPAVCNSSDLDEAYRYTVNEDSYVRFMTWYTRHLCINIYLPNAYERTYNRMHDFFVKGCTIEDLYRAV